MVLENTEMVESPKTKSRHNWALFNPAAGHSTGISRD